MSIFSYNCSVPFFRSLAFAIVLCSAGLLSVGCASTAGSSSIGDMRIVSVGGATTETIYALGSEASLVGTDTSSVYPEAAAKLPQVGYQRTLSAEGVISLKPTLVIISADAGPPPAIQQIENAGIKIARVNTDNTFEGTKAKIRQIAELLGKKDQGETLVSKLEGEMAEAERVVTSLERKRKVAFIFARGAGSPQVSGTGTPADAMIKLAGGANAITEFELYKPLTAEALVAAQPEVILLPARGLEAMGGVDAVLALPGVADTPAGKNRKIVSVDDVLLLGFSPRLGLAVKELSEKIK